MKTRIAFLALLAPAVVLADDARLDFLYTSTVDAPAFGRTVAVLDDVDGDTFPEFAVAASTAGGGTVYLLSGFDGSLIRTFPSPQAGDPGLFAKSLSLVPDLNDDGIADLAIGAPDHKPDGSEDASGLVYLVDPTDMSILQTLSSPNPVADGSFGFAVDGFGGNNVLALRGVVVGAPNEHGVPAGEHSNSFAGRAYVFNGRTGALEKTFVNPTEFGGEDATLGNFGQSVAAASGADYFYIAEPGANFSTDTFTNSGRVYWYQGLTDVAIPRNPSVIVTDARFGENIAVAPNVNRENGIGPGVMIGIPNSLPEDASMSYGRAEVYDFAGFNPVNRVFQAPVSQTGSAFGAAVEGILDVSGDSRGDVVVGQPDIDDVHGLAHVMDPFTGLLLATLPRLQEPQARGAFGAALAGMREHHKGPARRRLLVGAPGTGLPGSPAPRVYVYKMLSRQRGDLNNDKVVNASDLSLLQLVLNGSVTTTDPSILDIIDVNNDGLIGQGDFTALDILVNGPPDTTTTTTSTTTTLDSGETCGDANNDGKVTASDALSALKVAVGSGTCPLIRCDVNDDGKVTSADALRILRFAVGVDSPLDCPLA